MATIPCKICGGTVEVSPNATSGECPYCGRLTTFPNLNNPQRDYLYNRAERFRQRNDFDKAASVYESILNLDPEDPEAYWGLVLSRYGIEYVEDPTTHERIPTCHRVQFDSILSDPDYQDVLNYSSVYDRDIYVKEANQIAMIQKGILRISAQEKPYDIFVCYKEVADDGTRTKDSVWAQDIYYQLSKQGLKVFFSRITLEDKIGQQYEPYIFAALNSAKVMLVIGSKREYFESVWMRNEWSRFLALMKKDCSRLLIPCFRDMDPYDIPEELAMFQCQDMNKIGFMQDLLYGITKVMNAERNKAKDELIASAGEFNQGAFRNNENTKLMKRIAILMEQQDWKKANLYCEMLLESEPENPELYLMMCMITHHIPNEDALRRCSINLATDKNFQFALKFAIPERKKQLEEVQSKAVFNCYFTDFMRANRVSSQKEIIHLQKPIIEDPLYQKALNVASEAQKRQLLDIQYGQAEYLLWKCMKEHQVKELIQIPVPLEEEEAFQIALKSASPERREQLLKIQAEQSDFFLRKCMKEHHVSNASDLVNTHDSLYLDANYCLALSCALPEQRAKLERIASAQSRQEEKWAKLSCLWSLCMVAVFGLCVILLPVEDLFKRIVFSFEIILWGGGLVIAIVKLVKWINGIIDKTND